MTLNESEVFDGTPESFPVFCEEGTVGYADDPDVVQLGKDHDDGITLLKVTLFRGAPRGQRRAPDGSANGFRVAARIGGPLWYVPTKGTRVVVIFPGGDMQTPGNGVIVAQPITSPTTRFGRRKAVFDFTGVDLVITGRSVSLVCEDTTTNTPHRHVVSVSEKGGAQLISDGSGVFAKDGEVNVKTVDDDGNLMNAIVANQEDLTLLRAVEPGNPVSIALTSQGPELIGKFITCEFVVAMKLGKYATVATPVLLGLSGPAGVPSTCIWGAPAPG